MHKPAYEISFGVLNASKYTRLRITSVNCNSGTLNATLNLIYRSFHMKFRKGYMNVQLDFFFIFIKSIVYINDLYIARENAHDSGTLMLTRSRGLSPLNFAGPSIVSVRAGRSPPKIREPLPSLFMFFSLSRRNYIPKTCRANRRGRHVDPHGCHNGNPRFSKGFVYFFK